jgi:hypothetical protein
MTKLLTWIRGNAIAITALFLATGGGYAIAATTSSTKTITGCANKKTGVLYYSTHGRCNRRQKKIVWNQRGVQGAQGQTGATGAAGQAAPSVSALVSVNGNVADIAGGLTVQAAGTGEYAVTITAAQCAGKTNLPVVTVDNSSALATGSFPTAWLSGVGVDSASFTVNTGVVTSGAYAPTNEAFQLQDVCTS